MWTIKGKSARDKENSKIVSVWQEGNLNVQIRSKCEGSRTKLIKKWISNHKGDIDVQQVVLEDRLWGKIRGR